jgi:hypothetical protein
MIAGFDRCRYSLEILMCTNVLPFIRQILPITTNTIQTFIHFMETGNSQQSNNLKMYKNSVHTFDIHTKCL